MEDWKGKVALVTGASAGIGAAIATSLATQGMVVVGMARRLEKLEHVAAGLPEGAEFHPLQGDVSVEEDILRTFKFIRETFGTINVLINNAGVLNMGRIVSSTTSSYREMIDVNILGLTICAREAIALMTETDQTRCHVININSIAGHGIPDKKDPMMNIYPATKHAVTAINEILRLELVALKSPIKITSISPGFTGTEFFGRNNTNDITMLENRPCLFPKDIADAVVSVLATPAHVNITELTIKPLGEPV